MSSNIQTIKISDMGINGEGIGKLLDGMTVFVPYALEGEIVEIEVGSVLKSFAQAHVRNIIERSSMRVIPKCKVFHECGGCQLQHIDYEGELGYKTKLVKNTISKIGGFNAEVLPCMPSNKDYGYRNKIQLQVSNQGIGFFKNNTHEIIEIDECPLYDGWEKTLITCFKKYMQLAAVEGYNRKSGTGILRHIIARKTGDNIMICAVIYSNTLPRKDILEQILDQEFKGRYGLFESVNKQNTSLIMTDKAKYLSGNRAAFDNIASINYSARIESFLQINSFVAQNIYQKVESLAKRLDSSLIIDAYSGIGILTGILSKYTKSIIGIEIVPQAVQDADDLMKTNGITNSLNIQGDCAKVLPYILGQIYKNDKAARDVPQKEQDKKYLLEQVKQRQATLSQNKKLSQNINKSYLSLSQDKQRHLASIIDTASKSEANKSIQVILDPARKGCDQVILNALVDYPVDQIIYISCNPTTLARDLKILSKAYKVEFIQPYDMFPKTSHVECVTLMSRL